MSGEENEFTVYLEAFVNDSNDLSLFDFESGNGLLIPMEQAERLAAMILAYKHEIGQDVLQEPESLSGCRMWNRWPKDEVKP